MDKENQKEHIDKLNKLRLESGLTFYAIAQKCDVHENVIGDFFNRYRSISWHKYLDIVKTINTLI